MKDIISIRGNRTELLLHVTDAVDIIYWGKPLHTPIGDMAQALRRPVPYGRLDVDVPLTLFPQNGRGVFSAAGLEGHRDGQAWSPVFRINNVHTLPHGLSISSSDPVAQLTLTTEILLDPASDVLQVRNKITNNGRDRYWINRLATTLPLPERARECLSFYGRWVHEFQQHRHSLQHGGYQQENRRGRTSHEHFPAIVVGNEHFDEQQGEVWGAHLAWSGNHRLRVDVKADGRRFMQAEALYLPGEICLAADEELSTPWLYATYSPQGLNGMSQQFHRFVREQILAFPGKALRPVHLNTWEGIYFDHDPEYIKQMATAAARMGVERFIVDDGWFKGRNNDKAALGDWVVDRQKYPDGITPLIEHVNGLGMEFGIWVEPEMISKNSDLYRQHPDWLLQLDGYDQPTGRNQYVLDLQNPAAFAYLFERLDHLLSQHHIAYLKWDMNREVVQPGHQQVAAQTAQVHSLYRLIDQLKARHPDVEIESCAAGGGRIDYEILKRTQRFWPSDNNDALERQLIQRGFSYFFPPEIMGSHIGARHCHATRRISDIHFRGITALFGHMGIELDPVKESEEEKQGFEKYINLHKKYRQLLHSGTTYRIPADDPQAQVILSVVAPDQHMALLSVAQLQMPTYAFSGIIKVPGLAASAMYQVTLIDCAENFNSIVNQQPYWTTQPLVLSGEWLEQVGIAAPIMDPSSAALIEIKRIGD